MTDKSGKYLFFVFSLLYFGLHFIPVFGETPFLWGFDSLSYSNPLLVFVLSLLFLMTLIPGIRTSVFHILPSLGRYIRRIPLLVWLPVTGSALYYFRQKTFFLGDGWLRIRNVEAHEILFSVEEPLDTLLHTVLHTSLGKFIGISGTQTYQWVSVMIGIITLAGALYYLKKLYSNTSHRWLIGMLLATSGSVVLFFGYVESYTVANGCMILFLLSCMTMLTRRKYSQLPMVFLMTASISHPIGILLIPGALYAYSAVIHNNADSKNTLRQWGKIIAVGAAIVSMLLIAFRLGGESPLAFVERYTQGGNLLPAISATDGYAILSLWHLFDILNELALTAPAILALVFVVPRFIKIKPDSRIIFLLACSAGAIFFITVFDPKLGYARDWDLFAFAAFPLTLLAGHALTSLSHKQVFAGIALPLVLLSVFHTVPWIMVNASTDQSLARFESLTGTPYWTGEASGMAHESLAGYYKNNGDLDSYIGHYREAYDHTKNPRYFGNVVRAYVYKGDFESLLNYVQVEPSNMEGQFYLGKLYVEKEMYDEGLSALRKVNAADPGYPELQKNLGIAYLRCGMIDESITANKEALAADNDIESLDLIYNNLGVAYFMKEMWKESAEVFEKKVKCNPESSQSHFRLAYTYFFMGEYSHAEEHARLAQEHGLVNDDLSTLLREIDARL